MTTLLVVSTPSSVAFPPSTHNDPVPLWYDINTPLIFQNAPLFYQCLINSNPPAQTQCDNIREEIENYSILFCSDGDYSLSNKQASHGWLFVSEVQQVIQKLKRLNNIIDMAE
jgi:hypothetical protein